MDRLISEKAVLKILVPLFISDKRFKVAINAIKAIPSAEQKTGCWIRFKEFENDYYHIKCSECGQYWSIDGHAKIFKHCFNCGAKMRVEL